MVAVRRWFHNSYLIIQNWIGADRFEMHRADECRGCSRIECQLQLHRTAWPMDFHWHDNQPLPRVKALLHSTTAMSSGILPVYHMA